MALADTIQKIYEAKGASKAGLEEAAKCVAETIVEKLGVKPEEVAVLILTTTGKTLKFLWPQPLSKSNSVLPADHKNAIASSVLLSRKGKVDNKIAESKHLRFFENVRGLDPSRLPIQKMIALPLLHGAKPIGVLEVSRKGRTAEIAGPDFTPEDAQTLVAIAREVIGPLVKLIPDPFL